MYLKSPAKLNIGLSVVGRRDEGYHLLESLFWPIDFSDDIEIHTNPQNKVLESYWTDDAPVTTLPLPTNEENLITQLLHRLPANAIPGKITLKKRIPLGSGLGGGSSNVGTLLRYLSQNKFELPSDLDTLSRQLGADVPFFLHPVPTWISGIGEKKTPLQVPETLLKNLFFLLVFPPHPILTKDVFNDFRISLKPFSTAHCPFQKATVDEASFQIFLTKAKNDLEDIVSSRHPLISQILKNLRKTESSYAGLSGSGSTCFAIYLSFQALSRSLKELNPFFRKHNCRSVSTQTYVGKP